MKPKVIAYSKGLTVIPFENVDAVDEGYNENGRIVVFLTGKRSINFQSAEDSQEFIDQYNIYLAAVEGVTMSATWTPTNEDPK